MVALIASAELGGDGRVTTASRTPSRASRRRAPGCTRGSSSVTAASLWRSPSTAGSFIDFGPQLAPGAARVPLLQRAARRSARRGQPRARLGRGHRAQELTFTRGDEPAALRGADRRVSGARCTSAFAGGTALLLVRRSRLLLRWVLAPDAAARGADQRSGARLARSARRALARRAERRREQSQHAAARPSATASRAIATRSAISRTA